MTIQEAGIHLQKAVGQNIAIHIPHRYTLGETVPLILLLHWGGKKYRYIGRDALEGLGLPALNKLQAIIVAPDRKRSDWANPRAAKDLLKLMDYLEENYNIHPTHRAMAGYSMGGLGVWHMAENHPEKFACGIVLATPIPKQVLEADWKFPLHLIHSELDELFPFDLVDKRVTELQKRNAPIQLKTVPFATHSDVRDYVDAFESTTSWIKQHWGIE